MTWKSVAHSELNFRIVQFEKIKSAKTRKFENAKCAPFKIMSAQFSRRRIPLHFSCVSSKIVLDNFFISLRKSQDFA